MLILSHLSLGYPEATIRTHFVGQSRNLWNVRGHSLGFFTLGGIGSGVEGGGRVPLALKEPPGSDRWDAPFEATRMGCRNDRAIAPNLKGRFAYEINARVGVVSVGIGRGGCLGYLA